MTLQQFAQAATMVGAFAAIVSIIYGSIQVRNHTRAIKAAAFQQMVAAIAGSFDDLAKNPELCELSMRGALDFEALKPLEQARFQFHQQAMLWRTENSWLQFRQGALNGKYWQGVRGSLASVYAMPGHRQAWALIRDNINPEFREYVDGIVREQAAKAE